MGKEQDIYLRLTGKMLEMLEQCKADDFTMPFLPNIEAPHNPFTGTVYKGVNRLILMLDGQGIYGTFNNWRKVGAKIKKNSKGIHPIAFRMVKTKDSTEDKPEYFPMYKYCHPVFGVNQVTGYDAPKRETPDPVQTVRNADEWIAASGAKIEHTSRGVACYKRNDDSIEIPHQDLFQATHTSTATESYYSVVCHELAHWTGAPSRLDRTKGKMFGDQNYAIEELVAEMSASFQCAILGISQSPRTDHAQYIKGWIRAIKEDDTNKLVAKAAQQAQRVVDHLSGYQSDKLLKELNLYVDKTAEAA